MLRRAPVRRPSSCSFQQRARYATAPSQARAVVYRSFGNPASVLKLENTPLPALGSGDVRVQMLAAPINPADLNMVQGTYGIKPELPAIGGLEGFGVVQEAGPSASLKRGDYVIAAKAGGFGTWRNWAVCSSDDLIKVPGDIEPEYGATLAVNPCTAVRLMEDFADLQPGDSIVQNGANSTVGHCIYQIAKSRGIQTINIIRARPGQEQLIEKMKSYGADVVITDDMLDKPEVYQMLSDLPKPKLALNCIGGPSATAIARMLGENGTMVTYGGMSRKPVQLPTSLLIFKNISVKGFWLTEWVKRHSAAERREMIDKVVTLVRDKKLRLWMERHALSDFSAALEAVQKPFRDRKIILMLDK